MVTGPNQLLISKLISNLNVVFALRNLGDVHYFLGIEVHRTTIALHLIQSKYITNLLFKTNMDGAKPFKSLDRVLPKLALVDSGPFEDISLYRSTIGALQYLTLIRSDVAFIINSLSQFRHAPSLFHWQACKHLLRYLKGILTHGLVLSPSVHLNLEAYSNVD